MFDIFHRTAYAFLFAEGELVTLAEKNTWLFVILVSPPTPVCVPDGDGDGDSDV